MCPRYLLSRIKLMLGPEKHWWLRDSASDLSAPERAHSTVLLSPRKGAREQAPPATYTVLTFSTCSRLSSLLCRPWLLRRAESLSCVNPRSWPLSSAFSHSTWRWGSGRELGVTALSHQLLYQEEQ